MKNSPPSISVLIPTLNEAGYIRPCIESLLNGEFPVDRMEVLVIDGGSSDGTQSIVTRMATENPAIKLLTNPKKIVPAALNIGVRAASHEIIVWVGAHALYSRNYLSRSTEVLLKMECASVGGVLRAVGKSYWGKLIAVATNSKFGIGSAGYRHASELQSVDTVFGGCWRKSTVNKLGGFDENWTRNQDYEFNLRLRQEIGEIILDPAIRCSYFCRESLRGLASQYFQYGYWRFKTTIKHPEAFTLRLAAPVSLTVGLVISGFAAPFYPGYALVLPSLYGATLLGVSAVKSISIRRPGAIINLAAIFATLHLAWGIGFLTSTINTLITIGSKNEESRRL